MPCPYVCLCGCELVEGVRRLSLLLGILGACIGILFTLVHVSEVYGKSQDWNSYDEKRAAYERLAPDTIAAWEAADEHITNNGKYKFVKADSSERFSVALKGRRGQWHERVFVLRSEPPMHVGERLEIAWKPLDEYFSFVTKEQASEELSRPPGFPEPPSPPYSARPGVLLYMAVVAWPFLGFLLPWGTVRVLGWVIMGFLLDFRGKRLVDEKDD